MKLVKVIDKSAINPTPYAIYELNKDQQKKFGGKYALSGGIFSEFVINSYGEDKLLSNLDEMYYEGIFQTELEAIQQVQILQRDEIISRYISYIKELTCVTNMVESVFKTEEEESL